MPAPELLCAGLEVLTTAGPHELPLPPKQPKIRVPGSNKDSKSVQRGFGRPAQGPAELSRQKSHKKAQGTVIGPHNPPEFKNTKRHLSPKKIGGALNLPLTARRTCGASGTARLSRTVCPRPDLGEASATVLSWLTAAVGVGAISRDKWQVASSEKTLRDPK